MKIRLVIVRPGKEYNELLVSNTKTNRPFIPEFSFQKLDTDVKMDNIISEIEDSFGIKVNLISLDSFNDQSNATLIKYYAMIISKRDQIDEKLETQGYKWVHPREAMRIFKQYQSLDILEEIFDWIHQGDYDLDFLSNNLDKMR